MVTNLDPSRPVGVQPASLPATILALQVQQGAAVNVAVNIQRATCEDPQSQIEGVPGLSDPLFDPFSQNRTQRRFEMDVVGRMQEVPEGQETAIWRWVVAGAPEIGAFQEDTAYQL